MTRSLTVSGPAAADVVWRRYAAPAEWTSWAPHLTRVTSSTRTIRPGTTGRVWMGPVPASFTIDTADHRRMTWSWTVRCAGVRLRLHHQVTDSASRPGGGPGSTTTLRVHGPAAVVVAYLPVARWALGRLVGQTS